MQLKAATRPRPCNLLPAAKEVSIWVCSLDLIDYWIGSQATTAGGVFYVNIIQEYHYQASDSRSLQEQAIARILSWIQRLLGQFIFPRLPWDMLTYPIRTDYSWRTFGLCVAVTMLTIDSLSSYMSNATQNDTYQQAAELSAEFIWNELYNGTIILDGINLTDCSNTATILSYNSGVTIEGLADLASRNSTWTSRSVNCYYSQVPWHSKWPMTIDHISLNSLISTAVAFPAWTNAAGINTDGRYLSWSALIHILTP